MEWKSWTGWRQLTGSVIDSNSVIDTIQSLPAVDSLRVLSIIDTVMQLSDEPGPTELRLLRLVRDGVFLTPKLITDVNSRETILFHSQVRYALTQMIFKYTEVDMDFPHEIPNINVWEDVLIILLQLSDLIHAENHSVEGLKSYLLQSSQFFVEENWSSELLRTYEQYINVAPTVTQDSDGGEAIDLGEIAQATFSTSLRELFANEVALLTFIQNAYNSRPGEDTVPVTAYFGSALLDQNPTLHSLMRQFSMSFDDFKRIMEPYSFEQLLWPIRHFKQKPILQLDPVYIPLGLAFFIKRLGGGMYYSLIDNVPSKRKRQFQSYMGRVFEKWAVSELINVYPDRSRIEFFERHATKTQKQKFPEAVSVYPEGNIVWECKTKRLVASVYESGDLAAYENDVRGGIGKGIEQTYDVSKQIAQGRLMKGRVLSEWCLPVIVTLEPYPLYGILRQELTMLHETARPKNAMKPIVLSSFDFSLLCYYAIERGANIWTTLIAWTKYDDSKGNSTSLHQFLIEQNGKPALLLKHDVIIKHMMNDAKNLFGIRL